MRFSGRSLEIASYAKGSETPAERRQRYNTLSVREREVMSLVVSGMLNKQIAAELGASEGTIKMHRSQVMKKMQAQSLPELVRMADKLKSIT
jgi:FixJ family two-component response regulator